MEQIFCLHAAVFASIKMGDLKTYLCYGCCAFFLGIVIMSIALIATSLRKLDSDEGRFDTGIFLVDHKQRILVCQLAYSGVEM